MNESPPSPANKLHDEIEKSSIKSREFCNF